MYASNAYSRSLPQKYLDRLQVLQNNGFRAVFGQPPWCSTRALLECVEVFRVAEVFTQKLVYLVWRYRYRYAQASPDPQALLTPAAPGHIRLQSAMGLCCVCQFPVLQQVNRSTLLAGVQCYGIHFLVTSVSFITSSSSGRRSSHTPRDCGKAKFLLIPATRDLSTLKHFKLS